MKIIVLLTFLLDQWCKCWINSNLQIGEKKELFRGKLIITNMKNKGMAMGVLANRRCFVILSSIFALYNIFRLWAKTSGCEKIGLSFMAGGGISNVYDRFTKAEVTDYMYFKSKYPAPVFNFADLFALMGFLIVLLSRLFVSKKNG